MNEKFNDRFLYEIGYNRGFKDGIKGSILKVDLVAMLTDIQLEIKELDSRAGYDGNGMPTFSTDYIRKKKVNEIIQDKINALKAESELKDGKEKIQNKT